MNVLPGLPFPLRASWDGTGTNFSLFSETAERVELCLFDGDEETRVEVFDVTNFNWHCHLPDVRPGQRYAYRVWRGAAPAFEFARRFTGSGDLYAGDGRRPVASINLITAHDGFTLRDLVSYNDKY